MWKKIIMVTCIGISSTISLTALAAVGERIESVKTLPATSVGLNTKAVQLTVISTNSQELKTELENHIKNQSTAPSLWLLAVALLGFVMLSNRSGI